MRTTVAEIKMHLNDYLSQQEPVIVTRNGKPVGVLLAMTDEDELERLVLAYSPKFQAMLEQSHREIKKTGGIPNDVFWRDVEAESRAKVINTRSERRAKRGARKRKKTA